MTLKVFFATLLLHLERYSRGPRGHPAKVLVRATAARVQISLSPPIKTDKVFLSVFLFYKNVLEFVLKYDMIRKEHKMKNYEILSNDCKILWKENYKITTEKYTQVSGYIFNDKNQLLIVKNGDTWTIPGGHPEKGETQIETLSRELMEEACVILRDIKYLGCVEVVEKNEVYYQLRYTAKVKEILPFTKEWETNERLFVDLKDLSKYIKWANGITFKAQINSAKKN